MYIHEFGSSNLPKIILLHPMEVTGVELYQLFAPYFKGNYCFIAPDQGGHGKSGHYISLQDEFLTLKQYLISKNYQDIQLLYGASMGAATAYELLKDDAVRVEKVWLDGGAFAADAPLVNWMMKTMFHKTAKMFRRNPDLAPESLTKLYGKALTEMMTQNFLKLSDTDIDRICDACCRRELRPLSPDHPREIHLDWGRSDMDYKLSKKALAAYFPHAEVTLRSGYNHCGYLASHTKEYVAELERFLLR